MPNTSGDLILTDLKINVKNDVIKKLKEQMESDAASKATDINTYMQKMAENNADILIDIVYKIVKTLIEKYMFMNITGGTTPSGPITVNMLNAREDIMFIKKP